MAVKKKFSALGRGLDALISTEDVVTNAEETQQWKISDYRWGKKMEGVDEGKTQGHTGIYQDGGR